MSEEDIEGERAGYSRQADVEDEEEEKARAWLDGQKLTKNKFNKEVYEKIKRKNELAEIEKEGKNS